MKLKRPLLLILLLTLLTLMSYGQTLPALPDAPSNGYGIESEKSYPGWMVLEMLTAAENEIDTAVSEAYAEGYKAAAVRYEPELAAEKAQREMVQLALEDQKKAVRKQWPRYLATGLVSFLAGGLTYSLVSR